MNRTLTQNTQHEEKKTKKKNNFIDKLIKLIKKDLILEFKFYILLSFVFFLLFFNAQLIGNPSLFGL